MATRKPRPNETTAQPLDQKLSETLESDAVTEIEVEPIPPEMFVYVRGRCPVCQEKIVTNLEGSLFCPIQHKECPRNAS